MSKQRDPRTGKFLRTTPDWKQEYNTLKKQHEALADAMMTKEYQLKWILRHFPLVRFVFNHLFF